MTIWDEYLARYRNLPVWSPEVDGDEFEERLEAMEANLVADFSTHCPPSSQEDIDWFKTALAHEQSKFFCAFVLHPPREVPEALYEPMLRAAVYERNPSANKAFVIPCTETFGRKHVNETLLGWFENGSDLEKAGAVNALYHVGLVSTRASAWRRPGADEMFKVIGDLWMRQRCLLLREFVSNPSVLVRRCIIPHLELREASSYPEELRRLVPEAIEIAKNHDDSYIRHRLDIQMSSPSETKLFAPLPAMNEAERDGMPEGGTQGSSLSLGTSTLALRLKALVTRLRRFGH
jgi:hypothetical protein